MNMNKTAVIIGGIAGWLVTAQALALDYGPFQLTGFMKGEAMNTSNVCKDCQLYPDENKQRSWADYVVPGRHYGDEWSTLTLIQPYLGVKFDLGHGFRLSGLLSQRWRDFKEDIPGFIYEKNIAVSHEAYGSIRYGAMTTRGWSLADYPYGTNLNVADAWGASGAGFGLLKNAIRYTSPKLDLLDGDLVLEASYDGGYGAFTYNRARFVEFYTQYARGDLVLDFILQDSKNGQQLNWGHGPFVGLTSAEHKDTSQNIIMLMGRYQFTNQIEFSGGARRNYWSGAPAVVTGSVNGTNLWNNMFNVDWNSSLSEKPGYSAESYDFMLGVRYKRDAWAASLGNVYLSTSSTDNPMERGQSNDALIQAVGLEYVFGYGVSMYGTAGMVHYRRLGLSPMSMPSNSAFTQVDSRVSTSGYWAGAGLVINLDEFTKTIVPLP